MRIALLAAALLAATAAKAEAPAAFFGYSIKVDVDYTLDLESALITTVVADSPAATAGIAQGDHVTEIEGCAVPGCGAYKAKRLMAKAIGEPLHLKLKHADGTAFSATLIGITPPAKTGAPQ